MRWEALFADLELQWDAAETAQLEAELVDRSRREAGHLRLLDRLRPAIGSSLRVGVLSGGREAGGNVDGTLAALGVDWLLLRETINQEVLLPLRSVLWVQGLFYESAQPGHEGALAARLDLRYVLRSVARDRSVCQVVVLDGSTVNGTINRVGADFVEMAEYPDEFRQARSVRAVRTIPVAAIAFVRRTA